MALIEKYSPIVTAIILTVWMYFYKHFFINFNQLFDQLTTNSLSVCGTLVGFFLTILTVIQTINTRRMRFLKDSGNFPILVNYLNTTIIWHIIVISITMLLPVIRQFAFLNKFAIEGKFIIIFAILFSWTLSVRFTYLFVKLLHDPTPKQSDRQFYQLD